MNISIRKQFFQAIAGAATVIAAGACLPGCETLQSKSASRAGIFQPRPGIPQPYVAPLDSAMTSPVEEDLTNRDGIRHSTPGARPQLAPLPDIHIQPVAEPVVRIVEPPPAVMTTPAPLPAVPEVKSVEYTVQKGDTLWDIARMYGLSSKELAAFNNISDPKGLRIGMTVKIPPGGKFIPVDKRPSVKKKSSKPSGKKESSQMAIPGSNKYTVEKGDSLWLIARKFGLTVQELKALNSLQSDALQPGQVLVLKDDSVGMRAHRAAPGGAAAPTVYKGAAGVTTANDSEIDVSINVPVVKSAKGMAKVAAKDLKNLPHYVAEGDTLESIAEIYGSKVEWILNANLDIKTNKDLQIGKEIMVPCPDL